VRHELSRRSTDLSFVRPCGAGRRTAGLRGGGIKYLKSKQSIAGSTRDRSSAALVWGLSPREAAILAAIVLATVAIYLPSLRNGWVWDDWPQIADNKLIHSWSFVWRSFIHDAWWFLDPRGPPQSAYYRPLQNVWFAANALVFGTHPALWHLAKILLHGVAVVLCFRVTQLLTGDVAVGLLTAAIFGLLPANVESVVWASGISKPLATIFEMGALCCFINREPGWSRGLAFALMLYAGATLSHETAILFPLIVAAYVFLFEGGDEGSGAQAQAARTGPRTISALRAATPFVLVAIAYMCARVNALGVGTLFGLHQQATGMISRGFVEAPPDYSQSQILMTLPVVLIAYLGVLAIPSMAAPTHAVQWIMRPEPILFISAAALVILGAAAFVLAWRSSNRRIYLFCAAWSFLTMAPSLNLKYLFYLIADRYLYAPSIGWSLAVAITASSIAAAGPRARKAVGAAMAMLLVLYAASAVQIEHYWHDDVTFFQRCVEIVPHAPIYRLELVGVMDKARDFEGAARVLERGTTLDPNDAYLHLRLAQEYQKMGRQLDFEREFRKFTELSAGTIQRQRAAESSGASQPPGAP